MTGHALLILGAGAIAGITFAAYLVAARHHPLLLGITLGVPVAVASAAALGTTPIAPTASALLLGTSFVLGYMANAYRITAGQWRAPLMTGPRSPARAEGNGEAADNIAIIYYADGESPAFDSDPWIAWHRDLDTFKLRTIPRLARPFSLLLMRGRYRLMGSPSPTRRIHFANVEALAARLEDMKYTCIGPAFLRDRPTLKEAVAAAVGRGAETLVLLNVFLTEGENLDLEGVSQLKSATPITPTRPLWDEPLLREACARRIADAARRDCAAGASADGSAGSGLDSDKEGAAAGGTEDAQDYFDAFDIGVVLVAKGQPKRWDERFPEEIHKQTAFAKGIRNRLIQDGFKPGKVLLAHLAWRDPTIPEQIERLLTVGCTRVLVAPTWLSADGLVNLYELPRQARRVQTPPGCRIVIVGGWNDAVLGAAESRLREAATPSLRKLLRKSA